MPTRLKQRRVLDPTRTTTVRKMLTAELRRRFARLRGEIIKLLVIDDAFGLKRRQAFNAFCPTGEGGGVDASCGSGGLGAKLVGKVKGAYRKFTDRYGKVGAIAMMAAMAVTMPIPGNILGVIGAAEVIRAGVKLVKNESIEDMLDDMMALAEEMGIEADRDKLKEALAKILSSGVTNAEAEVPVREWQFKVASEQVTAFQKWLRKMYGKHLSVDQLMRKYAMEGYKRGAGRAFDDTKNYPKPDDTTKDFYVKTRDEFLRESFGRPVGQERIRQLAQRSFDDLANVTDDMTTRISRTLLDGLVRGDHPDNIAKELTADFNFSERRAETIARTEIIRAHAEGQLDAMTRLGVTEVGVQVEWVTAGDDRVCPSCAAMEGTTLPVEKAHNLIPFHPNCRCAWVPAGDALYAEGEGEDVENVFCPTGEGGGVDATCSPGGGGSAVAGYSEAAKAGKSSLDLHKGPDGQLTPERRALHEKIVAKQFKGKTEVDSPVAVVMGGGPAAGKSTLRGKLGIDPNTVDVAPDDMMPDLPEYSAMLEARDPMAATFCYPEGGKLGGEVLDKAVEGGKYNLLVDGIGNRSVEYMKGLTDRLRASGKQVKAHYVTADVEEAVTRARIRGEQTGRFVGEAVTRKLHADVAKMLPDAVKAGLFDEFTLHDTSHGRVVASARGTNLVVHDQELWDRFLARGQA